MQQEFEAAEERVERTFRQLEIYTLHRDVAIQFLLAELQLHFADSTRRPFRFYASGGTSLMEALLFGKRALWHLIPQIFLRCPTQGRDSRPELVHRAVSEAFRFGFRYQLFYDLFFGSHHS